jgi:hypothetical protein
MLFRTLLSGLWGAMTMVIGYLVAWWIGVVRSFEGNYWYWLLACGIGFVAMAAGNVVNESLGFYKVSLWRRFFPRRRK